MADSILIAHVAMCDIMQREPTKGVYCLAKNTNKTEFQKSKNNNKNQESNPQEKPVSFTVALLEQYRKKNPVTSSEFMKRLSEDRKYYDNQEFSCMAVVGENAES